jgi:hypothetical protein
VRQQPADQHLAATQQRPPGRAPVPQTRPADRLPHPEPKLVWSDDDGDDDLYSVERAPWRMTWEIQAVLLLILMLDASFCMFLVWLRYS